MKGSWFHIPNVECGDFNIQLFKKNSTRLIEEKKLQTIYYDFCFKTGIWKYDTKSFNRKLFDFYKLLTNNMSSYQLIIHALLLSENITLTWLIWRQRVKVKIFKEDKSMVYILYDWCKHFFHIIHRLHATIDHSFH